MNHYELPYRPYAGATPQNGGRRALPRLERLVSAAVRTSGTGRAWYSVIGGAFSIGPVWADEDAARAIFDAKSRVDTTGPSMLYTFQGGAWSLVPALQARTTGLMATYDETTSSIAARVGDPFVVKFKSNASTGFSWIVDLPAMDILRLTAGVYGNYVADPVPAGIVGSGGTQQFGFTAAGPGMTRLHFSLLPPGSGTAVQDKYVDVRVT